VEGNRPTPGLLMVGGIGAGSDSSLKRWGAVSEGARDEMGFSAAGVSAPGKRLEVVQRP
jgi:hypothetical protein